MHIHLGSRAPRCVCAILAGMLVAPGAAAAAARVDARPLGSVEMRGRVVQAEKVRGERVGQVVRRRWTLVPDGCVGSVCQAIHVDRERGDKRHDQLTLTRVAPGRYRGKGVFYAPLRCQGRVYVRGSRVPYRITLTVTQATRVQSIAFARQMTATYLNRGRQDLTPCPLGPSHDAGRYHGRVVSALPRPPQAGFGVALDPHTDVAQFTDTSSVTTPGAQIVTHAWDFGDPASGALNGSAEASPTHAFSQSGVHTVKLAVVDSNGLLGFAAQPVTAFGPPTASFSFLPQYATTYAFSDRSQPGVGGAVIASWSWDFGDRASVANHSGERSPTHTFSGPGTYSVTLTVTDANGRQASRTQSVTVAATLR